MREASGNTTAGDQRIPNSGGGGGGESATTNMIIRGAVEKEKTKLRERQRRAITTKIFHGLRKHGGYPLTPRADINQVLRHLAREAGWIIEPDGTTYRSLSPSSSMITCTASAPSKATVCPLCGSAAEKANFVGSSGGGGECSTTASPSRLTTVGNSIHLPLVAPPCMYGGVGGGETHDVVTAGEGSAAWSASAYMEAAQ